MTGFSHGSFDAFRLKQSGMNVGARKAEEQEIRAAGQAAAREEKENVQLLQHEVAALKRINAQEQLRQMEKELVIDREKTL